MTFTCIWDSLDPNAINSVSMHIGEIDNNGPLLLAYALRNVTFNPIATLNSRSQELASLSLVNHNNNVAAFNNYLKLILHDIQAYRSSYNNATLMLQLFKAYKTLGNNEFTTFATQMETKQAMRRLPSSNSLWAKMVAKYKLFV